MNNGIFVHQEGYIAKVLKHFYINKWHLLFTPMVVRLLDVDKDSFRPREKNEELLGSEVSYLSVIWALMYLVNYMCPDISFVVNLLARYSSSPTQRHWNKVKHVLRYLRGTMGMGYFIPKYPNSN